MARESLQEVMNRLHLLIRAGYPVIYVVSYEEARVLDCLARIVRVISGEGPAKNLLTWYDGVGLQQYQTLPPLRATGEIDWLSLEGIPIDSTLRKQACTQPDQAMAAIRDAGPEGGNFVLANSLTVFFDLHPHLQTMPLTGTAGGHVRSLRNTADSLRKYYDSRRLAPRPEGRVYKTIVVVAPSAENLSPELTRDLIQIEFPLPEIAELRGELDRMVSADPPLLRFRQGVSEADQTGLGDLIAGAGRGLTLEDYKRGLNMFAVRGQELSEDRIGDMLNLKAKAINNAALHYTPHVDISLGGLHAIEEWIQIRREAAISESVRREYRLPEPKGVMLCGVSGGGKSMLAKLIAKTFRLALLRLDVGALFGSYIGQSEENTRRALMLAELLAPVVLWLDEVDKAFTGMSGGGDNGVSARVFGSFLTWLGEKRDPVFVVATANDFRQLLERYPEFGRKGRFDEIFWVGLPDETARQDIFRIYLRSHAEDGYLRLRPGEVEGLAVEEGLHPMGSDDFTRLCWLLSRNPISANLTGAEIEYAIAQALYEAHHQDRHAVAPHHDQFTASLVFRVVRRSATQALYAPGGSAHTLLRELEAKADANGWLFIGQRA